MLKTRENPNIKREDTAMRLHVAVKTKRENEMAIDKLWHFYDVGIEELKQIVRNYGLQNTSILTYGKWDNKFYAEERAKVEKIME